MNLIRIKDYQGNCWWCNSIANSREHKYKSTDLKREFGKYAFKGDYQVLRFLGEEGDEHYVQGPNSDKVKFKKTICKKCNVERSKKMDDAYNLFVEYLKNNEERIYDLKFLNLSDIFPNNWEEQILSVKRYLVKHICCRLAEECIEIKKNIIDFLNGSNQLESISIAMDLKLDKIDWVRNGGGTIISLSQLLGDKMKTEDSYKSIFGYYDYRGFSFFFCYSLIGKINSNIESELVLLNEIDNPEYFRIKKEREYK